jgi:hypothetical protein
MERNMKTIAKIIFIFGVMGFLAGCISTQLQQPIPKNNKFGILSVYNNYADFRHIGVTPAQNQEYKHSLPSLQLNAKITKNLYNTLSRNGYKAIAINSLQEKRDITVIKFGAGGDYISEEGKLFLQRLKRKYNIDYLMLIGPNYIYFGDTRLAMYGYGLYSVGVLWGKKAYISAGYVIYLLDVNNNRIVTKQEGKAEKLVKPKMWKDNYNQISKKDINFIVKTLEQEVPASINDKVIAMMQLLKK